MSSNTALLTNRVSYSIDVVRDEARRLVAKGIVSRHQPIYMLCNHISARDWACVESELGKCDYLLRDRICDLLGNECWDND